MPDFFWNNLDSTAAYNLFYLALGLDLYFFKQATSYPITYYSYQACGSSKIVFWFYNNYLSCLHMSSQTVLSVVAKAWFSEFNVLSFALWSQ